MRGILWSFWVFFVFLMLVRGTFIFLYVDIWFDVTDYKFILKNSRFQILVVFLPIYVANTKIFVNSIVYINLVFQYQKYIFVFKGIIKYWNLRNKNNNTESWMKSWKEYSLKKAPKNCPPIPKLKLTQTLTLTRGQFYSGQLSGCPQL